MASEETKEISSDEQKNLIICQIGKAVKIFEYNPDNKGSNEKPFVSCNN